MSYKTNVSRLFDRNLLKHGEAYDRTLLTVLLALLCLGLIMVYSASPRHFPMQMTVAAIGIGIAAVFSSIPLYHWQKRYPWLLLGTFALMILTPFVGTTINGAVRWIRIGPVNVQPSELFKLMTIIYLSSFFNNRKEVLGDIKNLIWAGVPLGAGIALIVPTKDMGSMIVVCTIIICMLFVINLPWRWIFLLLGLGVLGFVGMILLGSQFRLQRIEAMFAPWDEPYGIGYQTMGALMAINHGGVWGVGLGNGIFKKGYLPESHTDFILAVIGEELGYIGIIIVISAFLWVIWRALSISKQARDLSLFFNSFLAVGVASWLAAQVLIHVGVVVNMLPNKGLTLPLLSYGGTSLLLSIFSFMLLLRVDYENRKKIRGYPVEAPKMQAGNHHE